MRYQPAVGASWSIAAAQLPRRPRGMTREEVKQAIDLYRQGWSLARIGARLGVYPQSIRYRLQRAGGRLRDTQGREQEDG